MAQAKNGDKVKVDYTGKLDDGTVFDSSESEEHDNGSEPLEFTLGDGNIIPGFEEAVVGMSPGDSKTVKIPADQAYGPHVEEMVAVVDRNEIPATIDLEVGMNLEVNQENGETFSVLVTDLSDGKVTLDANHPLAGRDLTFDIKLVEII